MLYTSFLYTPGEGGTLGLPPLSDNVFNPGRGMDNWIMGVGLATAGFVCFAINLIATLRNMRAPGMAWRRMPLLSWAATVIGYLLLVIGPVMLAALAMLTIDRHFDGVFFEAGEGGAPLLYEHLVYIFLTGVYAIVVLFAAGRRLGDPADDGAQADLQPPRGRRLDGRDRRAHAARLDAEHVLGADPRGLGLHGDGVRAGARGPDRGPDLRLDRDAVAGDDPPRRRRCCSRPPRSRRWSFGLAGELGYSVIPVGWQLDNTTASQGDTLYVLAGGLIFGGFAALHYWLPKMTGTLGRRRAWPRRRWC